MISLIILVSHALIDFGKSYASSWLRLSDMLTFLLDQMLHIAIILFLVKNTTEVSFMASRQIAQMLNMILFLVLITKPTNVFFKIFFQKYQPKDNQKMDTIQEQELPSDF